jgi:hypothetical protein
MTDLLLQDLDHLTKEARVRTLSNEKREMLGEPKVVAKKRAFSLSRFRFFAGSFRKLKRAGRRDYVATKWISSHPKGESKEDNP